MKAALLAVCLVAGIAHAEVIECSSTNLGARLLGAGMFQGEKKQYELMGEPMVVDGGHDVRFGFNDGDVKWVACWYEPATARWYWVSTRAKTCKLKERIVGRRQVQASVECR
jgi:hypothetical protein